MRARSDDTRDWMRAFSVDEQTACGGGGGGGGEEEEEEEEEAAAAAAEVMRARFENFPR